MGGIKDQWLLIPVILLLLLMLVVCVYNFILVILFVWDHLIPMFSWLLLMSLDWIFIRSSSVGLDLEINISWNNLDFLFIVFESFSGHSSLGWHLCLLDSAAHLSSPFWFLVESIFLICCIYNHMPPQMDNYLFIFV